MLDLKDTASFMYTCNDSIFYLGWFWGSNASVNSTCAQPPPPPPGTGGQLPALSVPGVEHLHFFWAVFHCEDLFLRWSSNCSFTGVNCWSHPIFSGVNCSSQHVISFLTDVNCWSHPIFYGANYSSHHVVSFFAGVNGLSHPMVYCATVQATIIVSSLIHGC